MTAMDENWRQAVAHSLTVFINEAVKQHPLTDELGGTETPIETALGIAMDIIGRVALAKQTVQTDNGWDLRLIETWMGNHPSEKWRIYPQVHIGSARVDFFVSYRTADGLSGIVVECDGHDFHEKTKEQAARDKARDRAIAKHGYQVLRYTGSEIWADPCACALEVLNLVAKRVAEGVQEAKETADLTE